MIGKITVDEAAEIIHASPQYLRVAMQTDRLDIGFCVKMSSRWTYNISPKKLADYSGKDIEREVAAIRERKAMRRKAGKGG